MLIGPNGGGRSTLVECFQKISIRHGNVSFTSGKRNKQSGDKVSIEVIFDESSASLSTVEGGGSKAVWNTSNRPRVYFLPARRVFNPYFGRNIWDRSTYIDNPEISQFRASVSNNFSYRLFDISKNSEDFNNLFWRILGKNFEFFLYNMKTGPSMMYHRMAMIDASAEEQARMKARIDVFCSIINSSFAG